MKVYDFQNILNPLIRECGRKFICALSFVLFGKITSSTIPVLSVMLDFPKK